MTNEKNHIFKFLQIIERYEQFFGNVKSQSPRGVRLVFHGYQKIGFFKLNYFKEKF